MSNRIDQELSRVMAAMSETAPPKPELDIAAERDTIPTRRPRRSVGWALASLVLALGVVGSLVVMSSQNSPAPIVVAMSNPEESSAAVGTFPHLIIVGWTLTGVEEDFNDVSYSYERNGEQATIDIEFGDQQALNERIADTVATLGDPYVVEITEIDEQQVAILGTDDANGDISAVWGNAGRIYEMTTTGIESFDDVHSMLANVAVAEPAQWADAQT